MSSDPLYLLRILIREEMEYYGKYMGRGEKGLTLGSSSGAEVEIDGYMEQLQSIEGQIQQLEATPTRIVRPGDTQRLHDLKAQKADLEAEVQALRDIL